MNKVEIAFREAGQVIMAMLWGIWHVEKVSIGKVEYAPVTKKEEKQLRRQFGTRVFDAKLEQMMGGPVAQSILLEREVVYQSDTGASDFDHFVSEMQENSAGSSPEEIRVAIHEHESSVQADLKRMWSVVDALAQALISQQELTDYEIRSIVRTAVNQLPPDDRSWAISRLRNTASRV